MENLTEVFWMNFYSYLRRSLYCFCWNQYDYFSFTSRFPRLGIPKRTPEGVLNIQVPISFRSPDCFPWKISSSDFSRRAFFSETPVKTASVFLDCSARKFKSDTSSPFDLAMSGLGGFSCAPAV